MKEMIPPARLRAKQTEEFPDLTHRARNIVLTLILFAAALPLAAHNGMREIKGTIASIAADKIIVTRTDGAAETVPLAAATIYKVGDALGTAADMHPGSRVVVHYGHDGKALEIHLPARR
jgi:hypothetical protein